MPIHPNFDCVYPYVPTTLLQLNQPLFPLSFFLISLASKHNVLPAENSFLVASYLLLACTYTSGSVETDVERKEKKKRKERRVKRKKAPSWTVYYITLYISIYIYIIYKYIIFIYKYIYKYKYKYKYVYCIK